MLSKRTCAQQVSSRLFEQVSINRSVDNGWSDPICQLQVAGSVTAADRIIREADARSSQFLQGLFVGGGEGRGRDLAAGAEGDFGVDVRGGWLALRNNDKLKESNLFVCIESRVFIEKRADGYRQARLVLGLPFPRIDQWSVSFA